MRHFSAGAKGPHHSLFVGRLLGGLRYAVLLITSVTTLYPIVWVLLNSFRDNTHIYSNPFAFPNPLILKNFPVVFKNAYLATTFANSLVYSAIVVAATVLLCSMTAFYLSKLSRRKSWLYAFFIIGIMVPSQALLIPLFVTMRSVGLLNTRLGIILIYIANNFSFGIFVMTGFMRKGIPDELLEAAVMDGCSPLKALFTVVLPISQAGILLRRALSSFLAYGTSFFSRS